MSATMMPCRLRLLIAAAVSAIFIAPACAFAPLSGGLRLVSQAANVRVAPRAVQRARAGALSLRASVDGQEGAPQPQVPGDELLTPEELAAKYPPLRKGETREEDGMVQITEEELLELASKAGVKVKLVRGGPGRRDQEYLPPGERRVLKPLFEKLEPIFALPVYLQYPILLALAGGLAAFFIPLFGTGSLRDIKGAPPPEAVEVKEAKPAAGLKLPEMPAADDPNIAKSCNTFPMSMTPTCTDPDITNKGILKNLDKYKNWKPDPEDLGVKVPEVKAKGGPMANKAAAPAAAPAAEAEAPAAE